MPYETLELLIGGEWSAGTSGRSETVVNPATEDVLGELPHASAADLDRALAASEAGFKAWRALTAVQRQEIMERAARLLDERSDAIAQH